MTDLLHIGNVSSQTTEQQFHDLFARSGPVVSTRIVVDAQTQKPRGFGLVEMETTEGAEAAITSLTGFILHGKPISIRFLPLRAAGWNGGNDQGGSNRSHGVGPGNGGSRW